jgi:GNAT superfamily N-acetyltransferase
MTPDSINSTIRRAVPSDAENIAVLYRQLVDSSVNVLPERLAQIANDGNTALFVSERDGRLIATALVSLCADVMYGFQPYAVIENFIVEKSVRREGIGTALMRRVESFCLDADCSKIMLLSAMNRVTAHGFFERAGFNGLSKRGFVKYRRDMRSGG